MTEPNATAPEVQRVEAQAAAALQRGAFGEARDLYAALAEADAANPARWVTLALVEQRRGDAGAHEAALERALQADAYDLMALLMRGRLCEGQQRRVEATRWYGAALTVAPPRARLPREMQSALAHAERYREDYERELAAHMDAALAAALRDNAGDDLERFRLSLDILLGRKRRFDSMPMRYYVPGLAPVEFFDRALFPWLDEVEAASDRIRAELLGVLGAESEFVPYIQYRADAPVAQWAELNHSLRWSVYHLWKDGKPVPEHIARCPETARVLQATPQPVQHGRTPVALFSVLKPRTRIPPHVGASNARLICHLALIVPPNCRYRVGNSRREWVPGKAWVFDDTIEHEAINDSDQPRVVLIWDTWHPGLSDAERRMISAMYEALDAFVGGDPEFTA